MSRYRRWRQPGGAYFFTANLRDRRTRLLVERIADLRRVIQHVRDTRPFHIDAAVILPEHLHMLWTLPPGDDDFSTRWRLIKGGFTRAVRPTPSRSPGRRRKGEHDIWQRRYFEHCIRDEDDCAAHIDYIHYNPVKHGYAERPADWPHSSIHRYIKAGILPEHGGTSGVDLQYDWDV